MCFSYHARLLAGVLTLAALGGCANAPKPLYYWNGYQEQVYQRFENKSSPQEQLAVLEATQEQAKAKGEALPPGFHAHLGMLYAEVGRTERVQQAFETEKALFPESAVYMDFLMRKFAK